MITLEQWALYWESGQLSLSKVKKQKITKDNQVDVKILEVGICGSDLHGKETGIMGHEGLGEVVTCGADVKNFKEGDLVTFFTRVRSDKCSVDLPCYPKCDENVDVCPFLFYDSLTNGKQGLAQEYVVFEEQFLASVETPLRSCGVLAEPFAVCVKAVETLLGYSIDEEKPPPSITDVSIVGAGKIGCLSAVVLRALYGKKVVIRAYDKGKAHAKERFCRALEVEYIDLLSSQLPPSQATNVIEATGASELYPKIIAHTKSGQSRIVWLGFCDKDVYIPALLWNKRVVRGLDTHGAVNFNRHHLQTGLSLMTRFQRQYPDVLEKMYITARFPFTSFDRALKEASSQKQLKVVIEF